MKFIALTSTADRRITAGRVYYGNLIVIPKPSGQMSALRVCVYDDRKEWMTFDPDVFAPGEVV